MNELQRHRWAFKVLVPAVEVFLKWKFNYEYDDIGEIEGPYLLLANHNLELDPAVIGSAAGQHVYFVASEHILRKGIGTWFLMTFFKPIIHMKGKQGVTTVKQMLKTLRDGHNVCVFPEGNRSFNGQTCEMQTAIGKVAKKAKAKLITYRVEGGYLSQPRWSVSLRKGKLRGKLVHVYSPEQLSQMTDDEINDAIVHDLYEDAYETQKKAPVAFRGKNRALGLEAAVFACPHCEEIGKLHSKGNRFYCECGFESIYNEYGELVAAKGGKYTVTELDVLQKDILQKKLETAKPEELLFEDEIVVHYVNEQHVTVQKKKTCLKAYKQYLELGGEEIPYEQLEGMAICSRNILVIHLKEKPGHIEVRSEHLSYNALKYLYLFQKIR